MKVTIEHYIATNNPNEAQVILAKYGVKAANMSDLIRKMHHVMKKHGETAVTDFASINTPYRSLLLSTIKPVSTTTTIATEKKSGACGCESSADGSEESSNACGCSGADGEETSGCDGKKCSCNKTSNVEGDKKPETPVVETKTEESKQVSKPVKEKSENKMESMMPLVIVGAVALVAFAVIAKS